jgi:hypothetical protein
VDIYVPSIVCRNKLPLKKAERRAKTKSEAAAAAQGKNKQFEEERAKE